jgi:glycosyltransferase involved in cell wall biosynthesis
MTDTHRRIIHVPRRYTADEWGGTETVIQEISRQQQKDGWVPEIHTSKALDPTAEESIAGIPVRRYDYCYPFFGLSADAKHAMDKKGGNLLSYRLHRAFMAMNDVRVFHAHALNRIGGHVRYAARKKRRPYVVTLHGGVFDVPPAEQAALLKPAGKKIEWGKLFGMLLGSRKLLPEADHVLCVGYSEYEKAKEKLPHDRVSYLPNGVDPEKFANGDGSAFRQKFGIPQDKFLVGNISRIDFQKNQLQLVDGFARFRKQHPDSHLLLCGPETQADYAAKIRKMIDENGLQDCVTRIPGVRNDSPDLVNAFHACDVFVLSSIHEPFGIVVLEAWSSGCALIGSKVGGVKGLIREGENGFFFEPDSPAAPDQIADRLGQLATNVDLRHSLAAAGLKDVKERYTWSKVTTQLEDVYQTAAARWS